MSGPAYAAPAVRPLTVLHIPEPGWETDAAAGVVPVTRCGQPMAVEEMWLPVERRDGDKVCAGCEGAAVTEPGLW